MTWNVSRADIGVAAGDLVLDDGLETSVIVSLFSDRRAEDSDALPDDHSDRRGWWGDAIGRVPGDRIGSRLWLLGREKQLPAVLPRAEEYAREALQWLIDDGIAAAVAVVASIPRTGVLGLAITIDRPQNTPVDFQFDFSWAAQGARH